MASTLIIVESPAKARTISKFVGKNYKVLASMGHIRDLPKTKLGVDVENDFQPQYVVLRSKAKVLKELKDASKGSKQILLAPDPDREGEAIAWHLAEYLRDSKAPVARLEFHEITKNAIQEALKNPREIDHQRVDAQQARRVLDRLVGYLVSPFLWTTIRYGLSAGRVQSVALRMICEREDEVLKFQSQEYWTLDVLLDTPSKQKLKVRLIRMDGEKPALPNEATVDAILAELSKERFSVSEVKTLPRKRNPAAPFITSTLQQEGYRRLRYPAKKTMGVAQELYEGLEIGDEGVVGLITYMRTDSTRVSAEAQEEARSYIRQQYGEAYVPDAPPVYPSRARAQDAHEAVRPTSVLRTPESVRRYLKPDQAKLYNLIWSRFVASQMNPAVNEVTTIDIVAGRFQLRATGSRVLFDGFTRLYEERLEDDGGGTNQNGNGNGNGGAVEDALPSVAKGDALAYRSAQKDQHFTEPPPRYTEASLVKALEEKGIGRPSTYATIVSTILTRDYVTRDKGKLAPTDLGQTVTKLLLEVFPDIFEVDFTARMESELDKVETGEDAWVDVVRAFYEPFQKDLGAAETRKAELKNGVQTESDQVCEQCGAKLVKKFGRNGPFLACPNYPECKFTKPLKEEEIPVPTGQLCPNDGAPMVVRMGRFGRFVACQNYPKCKTTASVRTGVACPQPDCPGHLVEKRGRKRGRIFYACDQYPKCTYAVWNKPVARPCPACGHPLMVEKETKTRGFHLQCPRKECGTIVVPEGATVQQEV
jgi:DNA topoisomerase-1